MDALITQNVDRLHQKAGATDVIELHGTTHRYQFVLKYVLRFLLIRASSAWHHAQVCACFQSYSRSSLSPPASIVWHSYQAIVTGALRQGELKTQAACPANKLATVAWLFTCVMNLA